MFIINPSKSSPNKTKLISCSTSSLKNQQLDCWSFDKIKNEHKVKCNLTDLKYVNESAIKYTPSDIKYIHLELHAEVMRNDENSIPKEFQEGPTMHYPTTALTPTCFWTRAPFPSWTLSTPTGAKILPASIITCLLGTALPIPTAMSWRSTNMATQWHQMHAHLEIHVEVMRNNENSIPKEFQEEPRFIIQRLP